MRIPNTIDLLARCWDMAEQRLHRAVNCYMPDADEESITTVFHLYLAELLDGASSRLEIEKAFLRDLEDNIPSVPQDILARVSNGIIAASTLHSRTTEKRSGGDFGLTITRPVLVYGNGTLCETETTQGLLCQAKLKNTKNRWNVLRKDTQMKVLRDALPYLTLVLYEYKDIERRALASFKWQLCATAPNIDGVNGWLKSGEFPHVANSQSIIRELGNGQIGTSKSDILLDRIAPKGNRAIVIAVTWRDDRRPEFPVEVHARRSQRKLHTLLAKIPVR